MIVQEIIPGRFMIDFIPDETADLKRLSIAMSQGSRSELLTEILTEGIDVYKQSLKERFKNDVDYKRCFDVLCENLFFVGT